MKAIKLISLSLLVASSGLCANAAGAIDSSPSYAFLDVPTSTLVYGLGGVNITCIDADINVVEQNPALMGWEYHNQIGLNYMRYLGDSNFAGVRYGRQAGEHGAWSAAVQYFGYGSIPETTETGEIIGTFAPMDCAFSGTYSHDITDCLRGGATAKVLYSSYHEYTAVALATDLGINYYDAERDLSASLVVANLGGQIKRFNESYDRLPIDVRVGWAKSFGDFPVRFSVTAWNLTKWHLPYYTFDDKNTPTSQMVVKDSFGSNLFRHLIFGAQLVGSENFTLALSYNYKSRTDMGTYSRSVLSGWALAAGLKVKNFGVGLAFSQPHTGATTLMVNLSMQLSSLL